MSVTDSSAVAIVGIAFEFPRCGDWESLTEILRQGCNCVGPLPPNRAASTGVTPSTDDQEGGWIEDITGFDRRYFGLSRVEAELMDPRQRRMLALAVRAIGNAGYASAELRGQNVAVLVAAYGGPEASLYDLLPKPDRRNALAITGSVCAYAAGRIAYHLDLRGAALVIDTSCSSFLVALHEARWKLARGEHDAALIGGYELVLGRPPCRPAGTDGLGVLSATGRCRPFDAASDGTTFGEGGGFVMLKRLSDALRDGDTVHAVVRGSAVNQDAGRSNGLTAPSPAGQTEVIIAALRDAGLDPATIGYIEAHGTGTKIGDPIEIQALGAAFAEAAGSTPAGTRRSVRPVVSSVKGNFGHLDCMAGFAGLMRVLAQYRAEEIFPTAHFRVPNPLLRLEEVPLRVAHRSEPWPATGVPRRAGISGFGLSGTNAHLILEEGAGHQPSADPGQRLIVLSARSETGLRAYADRLRAVVAADPTNFPLADAADVLTLGRDHFPHRLAWTVNNTGELLDRLNAFAAAPSSGTGVAPAASGPGRRPLVLAMGDLAGADSGRGPTELSALAKIYPGIARVIADAERTLPAEHWSAAQRHVVQLIGEHAMLVDFGVSPDLMLAHGTGTVAAGVVRGAVSLAEALAKADAEEGGAPPDADLLGTVLAGVAREAVLVDLVPGSVLSTVLLEQRTFDGDVTKAASPADLLRVLYLSGFTLDWRRGLGRAPRHRVELPVAPFAEESCWPRTVLPGDASAGASAPSAGTQGTVRSVDETVLELARQVLREPGLGLDDDFFDAGGNSLNGAQLVARLNDCFGTDFEVHHLFDLMSLRDLANAVQEIAASDEVPPEQPTTPAGRSWAEGPLSGQQAAIWAAVQLAPDSSAYNVPGAFLFDGDVDPVWLCERLRMAAQRHPMLRVTLLDTVDGPRQVVRPPESVHVTLERLDAHFPHHTAVEGRTALLDRLKALVDIPLSPYEAPPVRYQLVRAGFADRDQHVLLITLHHLFFDGWSWGLLIDDLGSGDERPTPARTYLDFAREQQEMLAGARGRELMRFWTEQLRNAPTVDLPVDAEGAGFARLPRTGSNAPLRLDASLITGLRELARSERSTLNMVLLAGWMTLLWKISGSRDLCVAGPTTGRALNDETVIGCYANTIVVRARLEPDEPFAVFLAAVRNAQLAALAHADLPADQIIRIAHPHSAEPVATTNFAFLSEVQPIRRFGADGLAVDLLDVDPGTPTFLLNVSVLEYGEEVWAKVQYATELFRPQTVQSWLDEYRVMLWRLVELGTAVTPFDLFGSAPKQTVQANVSDFKF